MGRRKYWLNVSIIDGDCGGVVCPYDNKKELRNRWQKDAEDFVREQGVDPVDDDWYPYFQIEYLDGELEGELEEVSWRELFGCTRRWKRRAA
jgi:hypothetical protein